MSSDFDSPVLQHTVEDLELIGYTQVHSEEGWNANGQFINVKVLNCPRNNLQIVLQTTKSSTTIEGEIYESEKE